MDKPTSKEVKQTRLDWHECQKYIEEKHGIQMRGYGRPNSSEMNKRFQEETGNGSVYASPQHYGGKYYAWIDSKGERVQVTEEQYEEEWEKHRALNKVYAAWKEETYGPEPPYMDFWHYITDICEVQNGGYIWLPNKVGKSHRNAKGTEWEGWIQKLTDLVFEEFGEYADEDAIQFWVEW
jgi:hypothetical protein